MLMLTTFLGDLSYLICCIYVKNHNSAYCIHALLSPNIKEFSLWCIRVLSCPYPSVLFHALSRSRMIKLGTGYLVFSLSIFCVNGETNRVIRKKILEGFPSTYEVVRSQNWKFDICVLTVKHVFSPCASLKSHKIRISMCVLHTYHKHVLFLCPSLKWRVDESTQYL